LFVSVKDGVMVHTIFPAESGKGLPTSDV